MVVANSQAPTEKFNVTNDNGETETIIKNGTDIFNKTVIIPGDYTAIAEYVFNGTDFERVNFASDEDKLTFDKLYPSQFKIFELKR